MIERTAIFVLVGGSDVIGATWPIICSCVTSSDFVKSMFIILAQFYSSSPTPDYDEIASVLRGRGHKVWVATPNEDGDLAVHDESGIVAKLDKPAFSSGKLWALLGIRTLVNWSVEFAFAWRLRRFIRENRPDVIHLNRARLAFFWMMPLFAGDNTQYILDWRQIAEREYRGFIGKLKRFILAQYRSIPSRYFYDRATFLHDAGAKQVLGENWQRWATVLPLAVNASFLRDNRSVSENNDDQSMVRFIYIGTLTKVRRLDRIILAAQKMWSAANGGKDFEISFIGPDASDGQYQEMVNQLDLNSVVSIKPPVPYQDVPDVLTRYDVALAIVPEYPLDWQYHPTLKILEYRALGMPIIATDFAINKEVVQDNVNGLLVSNSPMDIAHAMQRFVQENGFLAQCALNARNMRQGLLWTDVSVMYEQLYRRLLRQNE